MNCSRISGLRIYRVEHGPVLFSGPSRGCPKRDHQFCDHRGLEPSVKGLLGYSRPGENVFSPDEYDMTEERAKT